MIAIANVFLQLGTVKILFRPLSEKRRFRTRFESNMWKRPKYLPNLQESAFILFFIILREVDSENVSPSLRWIVSGVC